MSPSAKILRWSVSLFLVNALLVVTVTAFSRAGHSQVDSEDPPEKPVVEVPPEPSDPPSLRDAANDSAAISTVPPSLAESKQIPSLPDANLPGASSSGKVDNSFVLDEILRAIRQGDKSLEVPQLSYPPLVKADDSAIQVRPAATTVADSSELKRVSKRVASIKQLALAADALASEAQLLSSQGRDGEVKLLIDQIRQLQSVTAGLLQSGAIGATDTWPSMTVPPMSPTLTPPPMASPPPVTPSNLSY